MDSREFRASAHEVVDWMADYLENIESLRVKPDLPPRAVIDRLPGHPPRGGEGFETIFRDFKEIVVPGMTHWQHPSFFGYFTANNSPPSILAEMLTATMGAQCMVWATSPAATEMEERMMEWLREMIGLPPQFTGVIQDTASTATLTSIITAREVKSAYLVNEKGFSAAPRYTAYCSTETHSSVEKGLKIAGIGRENLRLVPTDENFAMRPDALEAAMRDDLANGLTPLIVVATIGTTGSTAIDPVQAIGEICRTHGVWYHVDAAFAGTALILPEMRWMSRGIELADTFVFNPHKWMLTNFDCTAYFARDPAALIRTFEILPEYLKTTERERVNNYRDWGIQLGRRFRALKLWFVIRTYGIDGLQAIIRNHIAMAQNLLASIREDSDFEILAPAPVNVLCFRYHPAGWDEERLNRINARLLEDVNAAGSLFMTHTKLRGAYTLRLVIGQTTVAQRHVDNAWSVIRRTAQTLRQEFS